MENETNILIGGNIEEQDKELFFGPLKENDKFQVMSNETIWADILVPLGIFSSRGQARKNGWFEIPNGFTNIKVGKKKHLITILKVI
jgi:hypothetical protein